MAVTVSKRRSSCGVYKMVNGLWFNLSKFMGLWIDDYDGPNFMQYRYVILSVTLNIADVAYKVFNFFHRLETHTFFSFFYLEITRNCISKIILIAHWFTLFVRYDDYRYMMLFLQDENATKTNKPIVIISILFIFRVLSIVRLDYVVNDYYDMVTTLTSVINNFGDFLLVVQFCSYLEVSTERIRSINQKMANMKFEYERFDYIMSIIELTKTVYEIQLLFIVVHIFIILLNYSYGMMLLKTCTARGVCFSERTIAWAYWDITNILCALFILLYLLYNCESTSQEIENFNKSIFKVVGRNTYLMKNDRLMLYMIMKPSIKFTAFSFFGLHYSLVTSIFAAVTTYLVMISQFNEYATQDHTVGHPAQ